MTEENTDTQVANKEEFVVKKLVSHTTATAKVLSFLVVFIGFVHAIPRLFECLSQGLWGEFFRVLALDLLVVSVVVAVLVLIGRLFDYFEQLVEKKFGGVSLFKDSLGELVSQQAPVTSKELVLFGLNLLESITLLLTSLFAISGSFILFPAVRAYGEIYITLLVTPLKAVLFGIAQYIPNLIFIVVIVWFARELVRFLRILAEAIKQRKIRLEFIPPDAALQVFNLLRIAIWLFVFVALFQRLPGADSAEFKAVAAFVALIISLSSTSAAGNFVAGLVMTFMRPFRIGDRIRVGEVEGKVLDSTMLVTRVITPKNEYISIPNLQVVNQSITNFTRLGKSRGIGLGVELTIGYDVPQKTVEKLLSRAAEKTPGVEVSPEPKVLQKQLGDFAITYELIAFTKNINSMPAIRSELVKNIAEEFANAEVEILSPIYQANRDGNALTLPVKEKL